MFTNANKKIKNKQTWTIIKQKQFLHKVKTDHNEQPDKS